MRNLLCLLATGIVIGCSAPEQPRLDAAATPASTPRELANVVHPAPTLVPPRPPRVQPSGVRVRTTEGMREIPWGASEADIRRLATDQYGYTICVDTKNIPEGKLCELATRAEMGDPRRNLKVRALLYKDQMYSYAVAFEPDSDFDFVANTIKERLGPPDSDDHGQVQNRMGASFDQEIIGWNMSGCSVQVRKRADKIDEGVLLVRKDQYAPPDKPATGAAPF